MVAVVVSSSGGGNSITINFLTINVLCVVCVRCVCGRAAAPPVDDDDDEGGAQFPYVTLARELEKIINFATSSSSSLFE